MSTPNRNYSSIGAKVFLSNVMIKSFMESQQRNHSLEFPFLLLGLADDITCFHCKNKHVVYSSTIQSSFFLKGGLASTQMYDLTQQISFLCAFLHLRVESMNASLHLCRHGPLFKLQLSRVHHGTEENRNIVKHDMH